jgi:hypothetical protein
MLRLAFESAHGSRTRCLPLPKDSPEELRARVWIGGEPSIPILNVARCEASDIGLNLRRRLVSDCVNGHRNPLMRNEFLS